MTPKWQRFRQSTNVEDRRVPRDITKPVLSQSTDPGPDPTVVDLGKARLDHFRAVTSMKPLEEFRPQRRYRRQ